MTQNPIGVSEILTHTTVRIEAILSNKITSSGTGFLFAFLRENDKETPVIVTNKHVIADAEMINFIINESDEAGNRLNSKHDMISIPKEHFSSRIIPHPEPDVDLCIILIGPVLNDMKKKGAKPYLPNMDNSIIPADNEWETYDAVEDVVMVGYPNRIWDSKNNLPVIRKGTTATHPKINYEDKSQFLIDMSIFPGSSGSPVFLYNPLSYRIGNSIQMGTRIKLLGIVFAVFQHTTEGEITVEEIPTIQKTVTKSKIPNNLGLVIKSSKLRDFEPLLRPLQK